MIHFFRNKNDDGVTTRARYSDPEHENPPTARFSNQLLKVLGAEMFQLLEHQIVFEIRYSDLG